MSQKKRYRFELEQLEDRLLLAGGFDLSTVEFRTIDGTGNSQVNPSQGAANTPIIRFNYVAAYPDSIGDVIDVPGRPNARTVSNSLFAQPNSALNNRQLTDWVFQWGQFITHDMDLSINGPQWNTLSTGAVGDFRIPVLDANDPLGPNPIPFNRSEVAAGSGITAADPRRSVNRVTSYLDASMIYGSDPDRAAALRTFQGGKLKTSANGLLPDFNSAGLVNDDPFHLGAALFLSGDQRANEQVALTATHALFVREHNRLATRIHKLFPKLNDEEIYQLARRIVGAEVQIITYREYLPAVLGYNAAPRAEDALYTESDATITDSFAAAIFRFGHSQVNDQTLLVDNRDRVDGSINIANAFFNPGFLKDHPSNVDLVLKGLASQLGQETDLMMVDGIRNQLFGPPGAGGLDLGAIDIQRARDHGLPDYNTLRESYDLPRVTSFDQISSNPLIQAKLQQLYGTVENIDAIVGSFAEDHLPGSSVGALANQIIVNQFTRLRDGDRFFYTNDALLASPQVNKIIDLSKVSLSQIIRWNTGITTIQDDVFFDRSVIVYVAPESGANVRMSAAAGRVSIVDESTGRRVYQKPMNSVSQVILVGSNAARDVFNVYAGMPKNGLDGGIVVFNRNIAEDELNVFGTSHKDTFHVTAQSITVNNATVWYAPIHQIRLVTLGGADDVQIDQGLTNVITVP